jgi:hypothetical protein
VRFLSMIGLLAHVLASCGVLQAHAQSRDPELKFDSAHSEITVEAKGATLGQILDRLFTERGIRVEWRDQALADKVIEGSFKGPIELVTQRLLSDVNYFAISEGSATGTGITRVVILGRTSPGEIASRPTISRTSPGEIASRPTIKAHGRHLRRSRR